MAEVTDLNQPPIITIQSVSRTKLSAVTGADICDVIFTCDQSLTQWEARADSSGHGAGVLVGSGNSLPYDNEGTFTVEDEELLWGDKEYIITIYGQNANSLWSDDDPIIEYYLYDINSQYILDVTGQHIIMPSAIYTSDYSGAQINSFIEAVIV